MSLPSPSEIEHADWTLLKKSAEDLGLNPKGRSDVVRARILDHIRRRTRPEPWRPAAESQAALLTCLGFPDPAIRIWQPGIRLDAPGAWVGLGRAQLVAGDLQEAVKSFDRAAQMGSASAFLHRAEALAAGGDFDAAIRACDAFLAYRPDDLRGLILKANFLARGGWSEEGAAVLRNVFEAHPDVPGLWRGVGTILLKGRRPDPAAEAFREAARSEPSDADAWANRGAALLLAGRIREATGSLREALEVDSHHAVALNNLGIAYLRSGQAKSAAVNLQRAAKHLESPTVLLNLAKVLESERTRSKALEAYDHLLRLKPRDSEALAARRRLRPARRKPSAAPRRRRAVRRRRPAHNARLKRRPSPRKVMRNASARRAPRHRKPARRRPRRAAKSRRPTKRSRARRPFRRHRAR